MFIIGIVAGIHLPPLFSPHSIEWSIMIVFYRLCPHNFLRNFISAQQIEMIYHSSLHRESNLRIDILPYAYSINVRKYIFPKWKTQIAWIITLSITDTYLFTRLPGTLLLWSFYLMLKTCVQNMHIKLRLVPYWYTQLIFQILRTNKN